MATTTTSTSAIELDRFGQTNDDSSTRTISSRQNDNDSDHSRSYNEDLSRPLSAVAEASRIADAGVPEGGYGWVIVLCSGILAFWSIGFSYAWGVIQKGLIEEGFSSTSVLPWVGSLCIAMVSISAIVNARILRSLGSQKTGMLGIVLLALGELGSGFSTRNVGGLFVCAGVVTGMGLALCFIITASIPAQYFSRRRGLATGLIYAAVCCIVCCLRKQSSYKGIDRAVLEGQPTVS